MVLVLVFGSETLRRQAGDVYFVRTLGLVAVALVMIGVAGLLNFTAWWLKTWRGERLRSALIFLTEHVPWFAMMAVGFGLSKYLEEYLKWPSLLASVTILPVMFAIGVPWWRWAYPAIERTLLRASHGALRAGVGIAIAVIVLTAGGAWAFAYH